MLVRLEVDQEDQGVVVFDLLHRRLSGQGMLDDVVSVHSKIGKDGSLGKVKLQYPQFVSYTKGKTYEKFT